MYIGVHVKYALFFPDYNENRIFWADFLNIIKYET